ncbi:hypothetical protein CWI39_3040p0010, partial [Hamiltosporidium magnivora]
ISNISNISNNNNINITTNISNTNISNTNISNTNISNTNNNILTLDILYHCYTSTDTSIVLSYNNKIQIYFFDTNVEEKYILKTINVEFKIIYIQIYYNYLFLCTGLSVIRIFNIFSKKYVFIQIFKNNIILIKVINNKLYVVDDKRILHIINISMNGDKNGDGDIGSRDIGSRDIGIGDIGSRDSYNRDIGIGDKTLIDNKFTGKKSISNNLTDTYKSNNITLSLPRSVNMCNITNIHNYGAECLLVGKNIFYLEIENEFKKIKIEFEKVFNFNGKIVVLKDNLLVAYVVRRIEEYMLSSVGGEYVGGEVDKIDNSDKIGDKVDEIEDKDKTENEVDEIDNSDKLEDKLYEIEDKVDRIEDKVDEIENKVDRIDEIYDIPDKKYIPDTPKISYDTPLYRLVGECCMVIQVSINKCEIMCFDREKEKFCKNVNFYKENIFIEDFIDINVVDEHTIVLYRDSSVVSNKQYEAREYKDRVYKNREYKDRVYKDR